MTARKSPADRANRERPVYPDQMLAPWDGKVRGPELPDMDTLVWCVRTREWWQMIRECPQAKLFKLSDWHHLLDAALVHNRLWSHPAQLKPAELTTLESELRRRTESYGFTWADRRKYGIWYSDAEDIVEEAEAVTKKSAVDYRASLNGLT
jgi:hypothetical protein